MSGPLMLLLAESSTDGEKEGVRALTPLTFDYW